MLIKIEIFVHLDQNRDVSKILTKLEISTNFDQNGYFFENFVQNRDFSKI